MLLVTYYPSGLLTLLSQLALDYKFDSAYGRKRAMLFRFLVTVGINVGLLPMVLTYAQDTVVLVLIFCALGFANAACVGSAYEVCLQMPAETKAIQFFSIGLQAGGVIAGGLGLISGFTTLSDTSKGGYSETGGTLPVSDRGVLLEIVDPPSEAYAFTILTSVVCTLGLVGISALHMGSEGYTRVLSANKGGCPPPDTSKALRWLLGPLRASVVTLIITTSTTALTTGFYPFTPSAQIPGEPWKNAGLVVFLVYVNQICDLIGRFLTACLPCPSGDALILITMSRLVTFVFGFFAYISQTAFIRDQVAVLLVVGLQVSHGMLQTWAFVHSSAVTTGIKEAQSLQLASGDPEKNKCGGNGAPKAGDMQWLSKALMIVLQFAVVLGGLTGQAMSAVFWR
mmetsp:Transcript_17068/g.32377  ORF Transcript_17068/g.32377 Transcript_17068/m.32377 type:complete len:397 (+) Transcript_17068:415-1605(+)